jgi:tetratricopeptide (TPR) repeat protein
MEGTEIGMNRKVFLARTAWLIVLLALALCGACDRSPEAKSARFMAAGKKLLEKKDPARAILQFRNAVQATPRNPEAYYQLGLASLAAGDVRQGVVALRKTLDLNPKHAGAQLRLAELMTYATDPEMLKGARQRLEALVQDSPQNADALHALALTELKLGEPNEAVQDLERAVASSPQEMVFAVTLAQAKLAQNDSKGAEAILKKACDDFPKSPDAPVILGRFYGSQNREADAEQQFRRALAIDPNSGAALLNLATLQIQTGRSADAEKNLKQLSGLKDAMFRPTYANFLFQQGRHAEAIKEYERLAKQDPGDRAARSRLVAAYESDGRLPDAQKVLSGVLQANPKDLDALLQRGELFLAAGKYAEAEADLNQVLHLKPDSPEVHYVLGKLNQARGSKLRQREEMNAVLRLNPSLLQARLELAASLVADNAAQASLDLLEQSPGDQKRTVAVAQQRNWALLSMGRTAEARKGVDLALRAARTPDLLLQDAILKIGAKRYAEARQPLHEVMKKDPEDLRALRVLVSSYTAQNQQSAAVAEVRAQAAAHPKSANVQYFLGSLLLETGNRAQAKQAFAAAKAINPDYAPADMSLAQIDLLQSNWKDARQELSTILAKKAENTLARQWLGMLEAAAGDSAAAIADFRKVIEAQPDNAKALNNLAYLLLEGGNQTEEPLKYAQRAVELSPGNPDYEDTLGWVLYRRAVYDLAVKHLESSVSKKSTALPYYHLAMAYSKAGRDERGRAALKTALRLDSNLPEAKIAQTMFQAAVASDSSRP